MNKVILMGNLGADPELRHTASGSPVLKMRLATSKKYKDANGERQEKTEWHSVSLWGKRAEGLAPHLSKGTELLIEGEIRYSKFEKDGDVRYHTDIIASEIEFTRSGSGGGGSSGGSRRDSGDAGNRGRSSGYDDRDYGGGGDDDIPF